jgi:hypothetical protein
MSLDKGYKKSWFATIDAIQWLLQTFGYRI